MVVWLLMTVVVIVALIVYVMYVTKHLTIANATIDKAGIVADTSGWWAWLQAKLIGWKTIVLGWVAMATQAVAFLLTQDFSPYKDLPWTLVFEQRIANYVTFVCAALIPITHALGAKTYAAIAPTDGQA